MVRTTTTAVAAFAAEPASAGAARRFVRHILDRNEADADLIEQAELVVTELVTNSVIHTGGGPTVSLHIDGGSVRIDVQDCASTPPLLNMTDGDAAHGRGLRLVEATARAWGVEQEPYGKTTWALLGDRNPSETMPARNDLPSDAAVRVDTNDRTRFVQLTAVPIDTFLILETHCDGLLRDLELLAIESAGNSAGPNAQWQEIARDTFSKLRPQAHRAASSGTRSADLVLDTAPWGPDAIRSTLCQLAQAVGSIEQPVLHFHGPDVDVDVLGLLDQFVDCLR
jgi:anti-sigma regulatory factor (Ser/Thr protein kinase)